MWVLRCMAAVCMVNAWRALTIVKPWSHCCFFLLRSFVFVFMLRRRDGRHSHSRRHGEVGRGGVC